MPYSFAFPISLPSFASGTPRDIFGRNGVLEAQLGLPGSQMETPADPPGVPKTKEFDPGPPAETPGLPKAGCQKPEVLPRTLRHPSRTSILTLPSRRERRWGKMRRMHEKGNSPRSNHRRNTVRTPTGVSPTSPSSTSRRSRCSESMISEKSRNLRRGNHTRENRRREAYAMPKKSLPDTSKATVSRLSSLSLIHI